MQRIGFRASACLIRHQLMRQQTQALQRRHGKEDSEARRRSFRLFLMLMRDSDRNLTVQVENNIIFFACDSSGFVPFSNAYWVQLSQLAWRVQGWGAAELLDVL